MPGPMRWSMRATHKSGHTPAHNIYESEKKRQEEINQRLISNDGTENPFLIWRELGNIMTENVSVIRYNNKIKETDVKLVELLERYRHVNLSDAVCGRIRRSSLRGSSTTCCNWRVS